MKERKEFFAELAILMEKHGVELDATNDGKDDGFGPLDLISVQFQGKDNIELSSLNAEESAQLGEILQD